jgi:hypothetical protein
MLDAKHMRINKARISGELRVPEMPGRHKRYPRSTNSMAKPACLCFNLAPRLIGNGARARARPPARKVTRRRNFFTRFQRESGGAERLFFARVGSFRSDSGQGWTLTGSVVYEQTMGLMCGWFLYLYIYIYIYIYLSIYLSILVQSQRHLMLK